MMIGVVRAGPHVKKHLAAFHKLPTVTRTTNIFANCVCGKTPLYRKLNGDKEICTQTIKLLKNRCASGMRTCQGGKVLSMPWIIKKLI